MEDTKEAMLAAFNQFTEEMISDEILFMAAEKAAEYIGNYEPAKLEAIGFFAGWAAAMKWAGTK